jgi:hypothetical protein
MWNFSKDEKDGTFSYTVSFSEEYGAFTEQKVHDRIVQDLSAAWIEEHGAELLKKLTPAVLQKAIEIEVAKRIIK